MSGLEFTGVVELEGALKDFANLDKVTSVVKDNTIELQSRIKQKAPVDTGRLQSSYKSSFLDAGYTGAVGTNVFYSIFQELGTINQSGTPHVRPSLYEQKIIFESDLRKLMSKIG